MEHQAETVDAVAQAGRLRPVVENMPEMAAAAAAMHLGPQHPVGPVFGLADGVLERLIETRPAGAALEFRLRGEQRQIAAGAGEGALAVLFQERTRSRPFGALLAQDFVLLRRQLRAPFGVGLFDLELFGSLCGRLSQPAESGKAEQAGDGREQDTAVNHDGLRAKRNGGSRLDTARARGSYTDMERSFSLCREMPRGITLPLPKAGRGQEAPSPPFGLAGGGCERAGRGRGGRVPACRLASARRASRSTSLIRARSR